MYRVYNVVSLCWYYPIRTFRPKGLRNGLGLPDLLIFAKREGHLRGKNVYALVDFDTNL
jgi:hypothetical protein